MATLRPRLRPRFVLPTSLSPDNASQRLEGLLRSEGARVVGQSVKHHLMLSLRNEDRHFWSPWLQLEVRTEIGQDETRVYGRFSPSPSIWMGFALTYLALGTISLFAVTFAVSQWMIDRAPNARWVVPVCAAIAFTMWTATRIGQGMASDEMAELQKAVEDCLVP
ncbi:MAG: hypothetical protein P1V35_09520 [Planctomycetota bacterium]|nr:hypothetical protein [Planctomycetota bacterium]